MSRSMVQEIGRVLLLLPLLSGAGVDTLFQVTESARITSPIEVVLISGDGGWGKLETELAAGFKARGMSVFSVDSRANFMKPHASAEIAQQIEKVILRSNHSVLVGYSFGADLIPLIWPELSPAARQRVSLVTLIAPTHDGSTLVDPTNQYDRQQHPMTPLAHHHGQLPLQRVLCIFGRRERLSGYSSCPSSPLSKARLLEIDGGHELAGHATLISETIANMALDTIRAEK